MVVMFLWCVQEVAGLKEEDLPSEGIDPPTAAGSSSTLSESQYTHACTQVMTAVLLYTGIADLDVVEKFLKSVVAWKRLGLRLGLLYPTLQKIEKEQHERVDDCMMEMLAAWLQQQDKVSQNGVPSWSVLRTALEEIGERQLASGLIST